MGIQLVISSESSCCGDGSTHSSSDNFSGRGVYTATSSIGVTHK